MFHQELFPIKEGFPHTVTSEYSLKWKYSDFEG